jgi:hypothetical protein
MQSRAEWNKTFATSVDAWIACNMTSWTNFHNRLEAKETWQESNFNFWIAMEPDWSSKARGYFPHYLPKDLDAYLGLASSLPTQNMKLISLAKKTTWFSSDSIFGICNDIVSVNSATNRNGSEKNFLPINLLISKFLSNILVQIKLITCPTSSN